MPNPSIAVPVEIDDAIRAEAYRTGLPRFEIMHLWFVSTWPDFVRKSLQSDLGSHERPVTVATDRLELVVELQVPPRGDP
jgi:hypothetical protein